MSHQSANPLWLCRVGGHGCDRLAVELTSRLLMNWCSRVSSTAPLRVQVDIRVLELEPSRIRGVSRHRSDPVRPDSSRARAPSLDEFSVPLQICLVQYFPCDVLHLNLVFTRTCPRVFPLYGFSRRELDILCGTSCALVVSGIRTSNDFLFLVFHR